MKIAVALLLILALATAEQLLQNIYVNSDLTCTGTLKYTIIVLITHRQSFFFSSLRSKQELRRQ